VGGGCTALCASIYIFRSLFRLGPLTHVDGEAGRGGQGCTRPSVPRDIIRNPDLTALVPDWPCWFGGQLQLPEGRLGRRGWFAETTCSSSLLFLMSWQFGEIWLKPQRQHSWNHRVGLFNTPNIIILAKCRHGPYLPDPVRGAKGSVSGCTILAQFVNVHRGKSPSLPPRRLRRADRVPGRLHFQPHLGTMMVRADSQDFVSGISGVFCSDPTVGCPCRVI
jgi:hypothetical protein